MSSDHWWLFGDAVIGSDGRGSGGRQDWECYERGKLMAIRHSLLDAKAFFEDRFGPQSWQQVDLAKVKYDHPYFGPTTEFTAPTRVWVVDTLVGAD